MTEPTVSTAYIVSIMSDGTVTTEPVNTNVERRTTTYDIYQTSKQLASEIEEMLLADRISARVIAALTPANPAEEQKARIKEALSERKIDTPTE